MTIDWKLLWRLRWRILFAFALSAAISAISFALVPKQWAAVAIVRVGNVVVLGSKAREPMQFPIEPIAATVVRMLAPPFIEKAAKVAGFPDDAIGLSPRSYGGGAKLDIRELDQTNSIQLRVQADSRKKAQKLTQALVDELCSEHLRQLNPLLTARTIEINALQHDLVALQGISAHLQTKAESIDHSGKATDIAATASTYLDVIRDYANIQSRIVDTQQQLSFPFIEKTRSIDGVSVLPLPVFPKPLVFVGFAILLGLAMSAALVVWQKFNS